MFFTKKIWAKELKKKSALLQTLSSTTSVSLQAGRQFWLNYILVVLQIRFNLTLVNYLPVLHSVSGWFVCVKLEQILSYMPSEGYKYGQSSAKFVRVYVQHIAESSFCAAKRWHRHVEK